ncbi:MAG: acyl carrier protein [Devosia sp.]
MTTLADIRPAAAIAETILEYLRVRFPGLPDLAPNTSLLEGGAVDSLGFLELMTFLGETFAIELDDEDFQPANLETPERLAAFVARKLRA